MLTKRIIPCLDVKDNRVVKGVNFLNLRDAGDPVELGARYSDMGADELVFLDITATIRSRKTRPSSPRSRRACLMNNTLRFPLAVYTASIGHDDLIVEVPRATKSANRRIVNKWQETDDRLLITLFEYVHAQRDSIEPDVLSAVLQLFDGQLILAIREEVDSMTNVVFITDTANGLSDNAKELIVSHQGNFLVMHQHDSEARLK